MTEWLERGFPHIWLPYAQMQWAEKEKPLPVADAEGAVIRLADGRELIDGVSSWWTACHGYKHPHITEALKRQAETLPHIMFGGLAHEQAYKLAARLAGLLPEGLTRVFFSDSGSTSVEVAMKMAVQFWRNQSKSSQKYKILSFRHGYHGDTLGAMSVSDPEQGMHSVFTGYLPMQYTVEIPTDEYAFAELDTLLSGVHKQIAAVIIEPLVQAAGGMRFHSADVLAEIYRLARKYELLFIADEIATGFGRTGYMFACQEAGISPDIICVGKALTGGAVGMAATIATERVFEGFLSDKHEKALMHGPTYMANPLACAAANASLDLFEKEPRLAQVGGIENFLQQALPDLRSLQVVSDVRVKGAFGVVELKRGDLFRELRGKFIEEGVFVRPFGNIVYLAPPFVISEAQLGKLTESVYKVLKNVPT